MDPKNITKHFVKAPANIALIKYWGKKDEQLILPYNSSISLTLDAFYSQTVVSIEANLTTDQFYLNEQLQNPTETAKVSKIIDLFRKQSNQYVKVVSYNNMPTAAGVSSSSSGLAALVIACNQTFQTRLDRATLSRYARYGSGSACRSLYPGLVAWEATDNDLTSIGRPLTSDLDLSMLIILLCTKKKPVLSRFGMKHCVDTSVYYPAWVETSKIDFQEMLDAIAKNDLLWMGDIMQRNTLKMHATTLAANPPFSYLNTDTLQALNIIKNMQSKYPCFYTMDAGPNVKVLCETKNIHNIQQELLNYYQAEQLVISATCKQVDLDVCIPL